MEIPREELERLMFFEQAREQAISEYKRNPKNAENLTKLGRTLVELAQFIQGQESNDMLADAVSRLEEALEIEPKKHETMWWLGNALTTQGFQTSDVPQAHAMFEKAAGIFRNALEEDPSNDAYRKSLEVSLKGPELHQEIQKQMALQQAVAAASQPPSGGDAKGKASKKKKPDNELWYDVAGWVILSVAVVAWLGMLNARAPPSPAA